MRISVSRVCSFVSFRTIVLSAITVLVMMNLAIAEEAQSQVKNDRLAESSVNLNDSNAKKSKDVASITTKTKADTPVKWLPDLRVLAGAPSTTIDLSEVLQQFCDSGYFGETSETIRQDDAKWSIEMGNEDASVVDLSIVDQKLVVNWKPNSVGSTKVVIKAAIKEDETRRAFASFTAESWAPDYMAILMAVLGGSGLFLFGMKLMSGGLQAIAGARLRRLISLFTSNRFLAVGVGVVTTTLVQSSTATSVMALGFVDSGLMTLKQAIGVIIGANIGTTTTGWLLSLNIGALGLPILGIGALFYIFCKSERIRNFSQFALGLGMIFFGLETLKNGLRPVSELPDFSAMIQSFEASSMLGVCKCVVIGCLATALAHSSAATLAITMTLASLDVIDLNTSAAIALGSNIGTTITAIIVALGTSINTQRTAWFHVLFNTLGVLWVLPIFFIVLIPTINGIGDIFNISLCGRIALTHTVFNVANTIVFLPLITPITKLLEKYIPDKGKKSSVKSATGLASFSDEEPVLGVERSRLEVRRMFLDCHSLIETLKTIKEEDYKVAASIEEAFEIERKLDASQDETIDFISRLTPRAFSSDVAASAREQVRVAEEIETISDYLVGILKSNLKLREANLTVPNGFESNFSELWQLARESFIQLEKSFDEHKHSHLAAPMDAKRRQYVARVKEMRENFIQLMFVERVDPAVIVAVDYQLNAWRRVYEHLQNIAEALEIPGNLLRPIKSSAKDAKGQRSAV